MKKLITSSLAMLCIYGAQAQENPGGHMTKSTPKTKVGSVYFSTQMDGYILSTAMYNGTKVANSNIGTPRFTAFLHIGTTAHYNFNSHVGLFSGLGIKNIGFIEKFDNSDSTVKRRVYTIGLPLGLKVGNMFGTYGMIGGGVDFPFNFREKGFVKRSNKQKFNEWFGQQTPAVMPYVFIGAHFKPGLNVKLQYYPTNFLNPDYVKTVNNVSTKPYAGYNVNLAMVTLGIDIPYRPKS
ncbi:hypothetical protein [Edaphocola aurantiacus]|uniref:hypothetical protein n=1 Tax=Edaphocola aurantiacus TaxID=2601682 RepID=UPI001C939EBB|nr:hypothetical protein [Edaphocola aurantiacus]